MAERQSTIHFLFRRIALVFTLLIIVGTLLPWSTVQARNSVEPVTHLGIWRSEGHVVLLAGLILLGLTVLRTRTISVVPELIGVFGFVAVALHAWRLQTDMGLLARLASGGADVEGWAWAEPRWGRTLMLVAAVGGMIATLAGLAMRLREQRPAAGATLPRRV